MDVESYKYLAEGLKYVGAGLMAIGAFGAAIGVGNIFAALLNGLARNPDAEPKLAKYFLLGAGMVEALGIFCVGGLFILLFVIK